MIYGWRTVMTPLYQALSGAVQAAGFDSAAEAIDAAFGPNFNPWAE